MSRNSHRATKVDKTKTGHPPGHKERKMLLEDRQLETNFHWLALEANVRRDIQTLFGPFKESIA